VADDDLPGETDPDEGDGGLPPHPLDRNWFHPSELGAYAPATAATPSVARRREWGRAVAAALSGAVVTIAALVAVGALDDGGPTAVTRGSIVPTPTGLTADPVERLVAFGGASVVAIRVASAGSDRAPVTGSGVALGHNRVVTAAGLVQGARSVTVGTNDGRVLRGEVAGVDPDTDLALIRVSRGDLPGAQLASGDGLRVGQTVVALGSSGGDHHWASQGIVAAVDRLVSTDRGVMLAGLIETDVDTAPAAGGGAQLNTSGEVIGILTRAAPGLALPIDVARGVAEQLATTGRALHGWLGVGASDAGDRDGGGARIESLADGSPAAKAGVNRGDVIIAVGSDAVTNVADLMAAVAKHKPGDPVAVVAWRGDKKIRKQVSLGERNGSPTSSTAAVTAG
jgi:S1-C subfamily serine protease